MLKTMMIGLFLLATGGVVTVFGQDDDTDEIRVENARFSMLQDTVIISYDLKGSGNDPLIVSILLRKGSDSTFALQPKSVSGAVGEVRGRGRMVILWNYKEDVPSSFVYAHDYWFEVKANPQPGGIPWWVYAGGGAVVAGVTYAIVSSAGTDSPAAPQGLPDPPTIRPDP